MLKMNRHSQRRNRGCSPLKNLAADIIGTKPNQVVFDLSLFRGLTRGSIGSYVGGCTATFKGALGVKIGKRAECGVNISSTGFYFGKIEATAKNSLGMVLGTKTVQTSQTLTNKNGTVYPFYADYWSGKVATEPARADWPVVPVENRVEWGNKERGEYITEYSERFPNNQWNWSGSVTNIHHIKPRKYGGSNAFSNLVPISTIEHYKFNGWFNAY